MTLDYQQVRDQVRQLAEHAPLRARYLQELRHRAIDLLHGHAGNLEALQSKVQLVAHNYDPNLRCAAPAWGPLGAMEALDAHFPVPGLPDHATIIAADGSQIAPDRHAPVQYCLINVGAVQLRLGLPDPPLTSVHSQLFYDEKLYTPSGVITDGQLALMRDLNERSRLAELAEQAKAPVISFTDGPMELWGAKETAGEDFQRNLDAYLEVLEHLHSLQVITAGYVDKPAANLVVRLLEIAALDTADLPAIRQQFPLMGVIDRDLFYDRLGPGERSAIFAIQSRSAAHYRGELGLHFFYLNVGREGHPWLARVEAPAWVVHNPIMLDGLHACLVQQCLAMGNRPYPYLLHRAHEVAVVTLEEKDQVTQMIALELRRRNLEVGETSYKQSAKDLPGRTRYQRGGKL